ncbi:MAG: response regulator [Candidatus Omnitrophota bacterium]
MDKKRILLVDDEECLVRTIQLRLESSNFEVITAMDGSEALEKAKKEEPDLIVLDLMLPKMDGYKVCGLLKNDTRYSNIPIIILTARAQQADIALAEEVGADAYIIKPFEEVALLSRIKEFLEVQMVDNEEK